MRRLLPFIIGIVLLIAFVIAMPFLLQPDSHRAQLADLLSHQLGRKVVIGKLDAGFLPPVLKLHDVALMDPSGSTPALQVDRIDADTSFMGLLKFSFQPKSLTLNHWLLTIHRRANGSWDSDDWVQTLSKTSGGETGPSKLIFHQGECHWVDPFAPGSPELQLQSVESTFDRESQTATVAGNLSGLGTPVGVHFDANGHFLTQPAWSGDLKFTEANHSWALHLIEKKDLLTADGLATEWRADLVTSLIRFYSRWTEAAVAASSTPALLQNWKTQFVLNGTGVNFQHEGTLAGGRTTAKGTVSSGAAGESPRADVTLTASQVPLPILADLLAFSSPADGTLTGHAHFQTTLSTQPWNDFQGEGDIEVDRGHYRIPESTMHKLAKVHTYSYFQAKYPNADQDGVPFIRLQLHGEAKQGVIAVTEGLALFDGADVRAAMAGSFDAAHRGIEGYFCLRIRETNPTLLQKLPGHYLMGASGHETVQPIFGRVQGLWNEWSLRAIPSRKIPSFILADLQKTLKGK